MKPKWFAIAMLTILMMLSVSIVQVQAAMLDMSGAAAIDDGDDIAEAFPSVPSALSTDDTDQDTDAAE